MEQVSRRKFLQGVAAMAPALSVLGATPSFAVDPAKDLPGPGAMGAKGGPAHVTAFVGTQTGGTSKGVYAYAWDAGQGRLTLMGLAAESAFPTFLALSPDRRYLFTANEVDLFHGAKSGGVSSYRIGPREGQLTSVNGVTTGGAGTCFVGVDPSGRTLLCANYAGGSAASFRIGMDGVLSPAVSEFHYTGTGPNKERQEAPHVHRAISSPSGKHAFFNDLGLDVIHIYKLDAATGRLSPTDPSAWHAPPGSGPRALRFHPSGKWAYAVLEMGASVVQLDWDESAGLLTTKQETSLLPLGFKGRAQASEIVFDTSGRFAYVACRYYDELVTFSVDPATGRLEFLARSTCGGQVPRYITLDPSERWMLVTNQDSNNIAVIARDPATGHVSDQVKLVPLDKPQCIVFV
jgi:6-phosphogluconolactonase